METFEILRRFLVPLLLTIMIEESAALVMGIRNKRAAWLIILVNILTNPAANTAALICRMLLPKQYENVWIIIIEGVVFVVEYFIYRWFSNGDKPLLKHPMRLSLVANAASYFLGNIIIAVINTVP